VFCFIGKSFLIITKPTLIQGYPSGRIVSIQIYMKTLILVRSVNLAVVLNDLTGQVCR